MRLSLGLEPLRTIFDIPLHTPLSTYTFFSFVYVFVKVVLGRKSAVSTYKLVFTFSFYFFLPSGKALEVTVVYSEHDGIFAYKTA